MANWPTARLGDVLSKSNSWISILDDTEYKEVTVRLWGRGVCLRGTKLGSDIGSSKRLEVAPGQFIVSRIDARHGAFGLIPRDLDGAVVTNDFPVFEPNQELLDAEFLGWLSKTHQFIDACKRASEGTTNRVRLKENRFADIKIGLPELEEQRRIVAKIETLAAKIENAKQLRLAIQTDTQAMLRSAFQQVIEGAPYHPMNEVAPIVRRKVGIEFDDEYPELGVRSFGKGSFHKPVLSGIDVGSKKLYHIKPGDLVLSNVFAWEGAIAVAKAEDVGRVGSHRFITCVPEKSVTTSEFLCFYLLTNEGIEKIREASPGGAGRNRTLGLKKLEKIKVPIPDYDKQLWFNRLQAQAAAIIEAQADNQTELDALLPSILDQAFSGKL
ncbi:MAG: restriction endonuclease subunit S [Candidatus Thiodiazotropha weberae]|nr:restriction endonuclease subunit S [Candidatus Thiodiazotropha lotti]MCG8011166.1 restriction endonuclease subunit S [Candidatus Thiodiazotropha lotti]MCW4210628.1 restriction endonuclease subunit S [Candidatus Thiodiazotropha lotti]MCW4216649.1 restriction endonuclease subunit S [Candidatus Thiodiazotropha lotti]